MKKLSWIICAGLLLLPAGNLFAQTKQKKEAPAEKAEPAKAAEKAKPAEKVKPAKKAAPAKAAEKTEEGTGTEHVEVLELKMAKSVENRKPVDAADTFEEGSQAYTWVKLKVKEPETSIKLRYSLADKIIWTSDPITVKKSPGWRTWLRKKLHKEGSWKVEVLDADDEPVYSANFTVK